MDHQEYIEEPPAKRQRSESDEQVVQEHHQDVTSVGPQVDESQSTMEAGDQTGDVTLQCSSSVFNCFSVPSES